MFKVLKIAYYPFLMVLFTLPMPAAAIEGIPIDRILSGLATVGGAPSGLEGFRNTLAGLMGGGSAPIDLEKRNKALASINVTDQEMADFLVAHPEVTEEDTVKKMIKLEKYAKQESEAAKLKQEAAKLKQEAAKSEEPQIREAVIEKALADPKITPEQKKSVKEVLKNLPQIMQQTERIIDDLNKGGEQPQNATPQNNVPNNVPTKKSDAIFSIPIGDRLEIGLYNSDIGNFVFQGLDSLIDSAFFTCIKKHYQNMIVTKIRDKAEAMLESLKICEMKYGTIGLLKSEGEIELALRCVENLNISFSINFKWILLILLNFVCKHWLLQYEKNFILRQSLNINAIPLKGVVSGTDGGGQLAALKNAGIGGILGNIKEILAKGLFGDLIDNLINKKFKISILSLLGFWYFGQIPVDISFDDIQKHAVKVLNFARCYWFGEDKWASVLAFFKSPYFLAAARLYGMVSFLCSCIEYYKQFIIIYIVQNFQLFLEILNDIKFKYSGSPEYCKSAEKRLKDFLQQASSVPFRYLNFRKTFATNKIFMAFDSLSYIVGIVTGCYAIWKWSKS